MREFLPTHDKDGKKLDTDADREQALFLQLLREAKVYLVSRAFAADLRR